MMPRKPKPEPIVRTKWTRERIARLASLVGLGWDAKRIADDPVIDTTPNNVHRQAHRFGLTFRSVPTSPYRLPANVIERYDAAAAKRGITREELMRRFLITAGLDPSLIESILDDDVG